MLHEPLDSFASTWMEHLHCALTDEGLVDISNKQFSATQWGEESSVIRFVQVPCHAATISLWTVQCQITPIILFLRVLLCRKSPRSCLHLRRHLLFMPATMRIPPINWSISFVYGMLWHNCMFVYCSHVIMESLCRLVVKLLIYNCINMCISPQRPTVYVHIFCLAGPLCGQVNNFEFRVWGCSQTHCSHYLSITLFLLHCCGGRSKQWKHNHLPSNFPINNWHKFSMFLLLL